MTAPDHRAKPRLTVVGSADRSGSRGAAKEALVDGTAVITVGSIAAGGFGVEAATSLMIGDSDGRWWLVLAGVAGIGFVAFGYWLRRRARRQVQVGIVVTATDARRGTARAQQLDQQAEAFSRDRHSVTLRAGAALSGDAVHDRELVDGLADETLSAVAMAERLTPDATRISLIPTMPLHAAFWFGARLGYTHAREICVHSIRQQDGMPAYFPAVALRAFELELAPLDVGQLESVVDGGDPSKVALALDLQARGDQFFDHVITTCRQYGIGYLLRVRSRTSRLPENTATFSGAVEQICRAWRDAPLPSAARTGRHTIFLSGPVAIAVALGARLASPEHGRWTAFTFDAASNTYEPFPKV